MIGTALVVRPDHAGDVLLAGPAVRAVAAGARRVVLLAGPYGRAAAELLPGVDQVLQWHTPWIDPGWVPLTGPHAVRLIDLVRRVAPDIALILTSFHQSALPMAVLLRLAGTPRIAAISADYPGSLLDVRHVVDESVDVPEAERMLGLVRAAGFGLPPGDDGRLAVRRPLPDVAHLTGPPGYVALHPGTAAPARAWPAQRWVETARELVRTGTRVVVTGSTAERPLTAYVARFGAGGSAGEGADGGGFGASGLGGRGSPERGEHGSGGPGGRGFGAAGPRGDGFGGGGPDRGEPGRGGPGGGGPNGGSAGGGGVGVIDLGGATTFAELAAVLAAADVVVVGNTGPAHLAAAVGTPVVSLFAPVVPAARWAPYRVPTVLLGDQHAPCRASRARVCPVPGHPCLSSVHAEHVVDAVHRLSALRKYGAAVPAGEAAKEAVR